MDTNITFEDLNIDIDDIKNNDITVENINIADEIINYDLDPGESVGLDLLNGNGTDSELKISQSNDLLEDDVLETPTVLNNARFYQDSDSIGGRATSDDGINSEDINYTGSAGDDMGVTAKSIASADATSIAEAFNQDLAVGQNVQSNVAKASVVGADDVFAEIGEDGIDTDNLLTAPTAQANMAGDDGNHTTYGDNILNGNGTDTQFEIDQANTLSDQDLINNPTVTNEAVFDQFSYSDGGVASSDDGMDGFFSYAVGDDISVDALTAASADAVSAASAFNQNIVMGANVQANGVDVSIVGGSSAVSIVGEDEVGGGVV